jgi:hypothetical protein
MPCAQNCRTRFSLDFSASSSPPRFVQQQHADRRQRAQTRRFAPASQSSTRCRRDSKPDQGEVINSLSRLHLLLVSGPAKVREELSARYLSAAPRPIITFSSRQMREQALVLEGALHAEPEIGPPRPRNFPRPSTPRRLRAENAAHQVQHGFSAPFGPIGPFTWPGHVKLTASTTRNPPRSSRVGAEDVTRA